MGVVRIPTYWRISIRNTSCVGALAIVKKPNGFQFSTISTNINNNNNNNNNNLARPFAKLFCAQKIHTLYVGRYDGIIHNLCQCVSNPLLPFWHLLTEDTKSDDTQIVNLFKNILSVPKHVHVHLVWQLWMGEGLVVILQVVVDSIPYLLHGWSVRDEYKFFVSTKLLSISAKGSGGAWGDGTHIDCHLPQVGLWISIRFWVV